ncbi:MAG: hypothetical protein K0R72_758 [Clostridia bacterium]|jgi:hypothetical protein|nr:hypothetical protein [Clostridia bacterium]
MENGSKDFFSLISEITKLEAEYEELDEERKHLEYLLYNFCKDNSNRLYTLANDIRTKKYLIDDTTKKILEIELDSIMKNYYDLYKEKAVLVKKYWNLKAESGYIDSAFIFGNSGDENSNNKSVVKRKELGEKQISIESEIKVIDIKMSILHTS